MNNGAFCSSGGGGLSGHARARYTQGSFDKMNDGSFNNGGFQVQQTQMTGPGFSGPATGYRSQFQDQIQAQEVGLASSTDDDRGSGRTAPIFDGSEFPSNPQFQGQGHYSQLHRCYPGSTLNKPSHTMHPLHAVTANSVGPVGNINQLHSSTFQTHRMHCGPVQNFPGQQMSMTPALNHMLQSSCINQKSSSLPISSSSSRDESIPNSSHQSKPEMASPSHSSYSVPHQLQQQCWGSQSRSGGHHYLYQQAPGSSPYRSQSGCNDMSQGRRPAVGAMGGSYPQQGGQYMNQQMPMGHGPQQRFMMGGQMPNQIYGHSPSQPQMYMPSSQQPPGPSVSPAARPPTPQQSQQMQNMVQNSPSQPSPVPSVSSEHGSTQSAKHGDDVQDMMTDINPEDPSGENSRGSTGVLRPAPSPVGSTGSRSNTPASIPGAQAGSPMPVRPPSSQIDGQNRMTQSPMATQGYNQHMMPPPNSMGYMPNTGKMGPNQMPGHYPQYSPQYPQGNYGRQQPNMAGMSGPPMSGPMQSYPGAQANMYPNGPSQMPGTPMYGNMPGMVRSMGQQGYGPNPGPYAQANSNMGSMMNNQYAGYNSHMGPVPGQHTMQQAPGGPGPMPPNMSGQPGGITPQQHGSTCNKAAQAAQAAMMAAASSVGPRMSHSRGSMSPSRGMFGQSGGGPLAQMNNMTNSPNLGSPSLNCMSNAVEQLARSSASGLSSSYTGNVSTSTPSPVPKSVFSPAAMTNSNNTSSIAHSGDHNIGQTSPLSSAETHESLSRPSSTTAHHPDLPNNESTMGSDSSGGMPSDSTSVDSGFHSSDQGDKTSDSISNLTQPGSSPPLPGLSRNGEASRTLENISPPSHPSHPHHVHQMHMQHEQQHYHMGPESKMPYSNDGGVPLPPSAISSMPSSSSSVVTTAHAGPLLTSVTQSIASPVTSVSTSAPHHYPHPHPHHMGHLGGPPHMMSHGMGPGPHGMMPNGMTPSGMMNAGQMGGHNQLQSNMGGPPHNMMPPNMGGPNMNMNQNGPMVGQNRSVMGHGGPMMPGYPGMNSGANMPPMGHMPPQQQMNCMPQMGNNNNNSSNITTSDEPPEKKKKTKKSTSDLSKLFEMGPEPDRRQFLERIFAFLEETGQPVTALPVISKTPLDLYKLYFCVRDKGGFEEVTRSKKWRDVCTVVNIGTSASAAFTLKKNYIRYLFNYECKFDRGGINPAPILAQMEAQLAHKREQKSKRAPSPAGSNSNESFRPPSVPNNQMDTSYQPQNIPPYMQNPDGNMPNPLMGGNMMMGPNNIMGGTGPNAGMGNMMGGPPGIGPSGMIGGPGPNMMHGQQGMMPPNVGGGNMLGPHMLPGGPAAYGGTLMQHQGGPVPQPPSNSAGGLPQPPHSCVSTAGPMPVTSDSISVQDPFADDSGYLQQRGGPLQPALSPQSQPSVTPTPTPTMAPGYPGMQQSDMGSATMTSTSSRPTSSSAGYGGPDQQIGGFPPSSNRLGDPSTVSGDQFPFSQQFERPDRFDQSSPNMGMRPPGSTPGMAPTQPQLQQSGENSSQMYPGTRFPGPHQPVGMRPQGSDAPGQYPQQGPMYSGQVGYPGPQYPNYQQTSTVPYPGSRPPPGPGGIYVTPSKRFPEEHAGPNQFPEWPNTGMGSHINYSSAPPERQAPSPDDRIRDGGQWSPMQRSRMSQSGPGYMSPAPPSTPPMGPYSRQISHRSSPQNREVSRYSGQKMPPAYGGLPAASLTKKEITFPPDSVESVSISTTKRKKLTSKDIAPFEPWRLMLSLKSGLLAESTWALDTLNILLYDDNTYGYFGLNTLPGLLEVLTEQLRHCLMQMFEEFEDLETGLSQKHRNKRGHSISGLQINNNILDGGDSEIKKEKLEFHLSGANYTMTSRKGLPVRIDQNPSDSSVLELKDWDVFSCFDAKPDYWSEGNGNITDHILTHLESDNSNTFLSGWFRRKLTRETECNTGKVSDDVSHSEEKRLISDYSTTKESSLCESKICVTVSQLEVTVTGQQDSKESLPLIIESSMKVDCEAETGVNSHELVSEISNSEANHSNLCNGDSVCDESSVSGFVQIKSEHFTVNETNVKKFADEKEEQSKLNSKDKGTENGEKEVVNCQVEANVSESDCVVKVENECDKVTDSLGEEPIDMEVEHTCNSKPLENGDIEEPKLSPMVNHLGSDISPSGGGELKNASETPLQKTEDAENDNYSNSSPPVLKAECLDSDDDVVEGRNEPMKSTMNNSSTEVSIESNTSTVIDERHKVDKAAMVGDEDKVNIERVMSDCSTEVMKISALNNTVPLLDNCVSETEQLSASIVTELLRQDENMEEEAFHRDDPPLCVTPESRDELGRRCVCISNIIRSLSCVPGNEARICKHPGIMRILGRLLLLHHNHLAKPPPRKLTCGDDEEEREEPPRVYDDEHWWWDYLDQLRENTLVTLANICGHLKLGNFSEQVCYPLLEGLLHWVICPASVARDPLPTLPSGSVLSPQRLVLEALCKLCIHEINVDLLLATRPIKRLLELFNVLVHLLADRNHQITREFSIVLLSLLVTGESSAARAVALQHPSVSLLVDFLEVAEQNALAIANQQGLEVLQSNPEIMGTSLDMLRRAATILLHMARVPDNRKMFMRQQSRLLNLVMSQILDQSVSNTLSEVLFECSQFS